MGSTPNPPSTGVYTTELPMKSLLPWRQYHPMLNKMTEEQILLLLIRMVLLNTNMRIFTHMIKVISLMSYCTLLYSIIALVDCAESGRWSFVSLVSAILVALGDSSLAILVALGDWSLAITPTGIT
jgi:hypothetical protein